MKFIAKVSRNFRQVDPLNKLVILRDIITEDGTVFRDHCFVALTDYIASKLPKSGDNATYVCEFEAEIAQTNYRKRDYQQTLDNISNFKLKEKLSIKKKAKLVTNSKKKPGKVLKY